MNHWPLVIWVLEHTQHGGAFHFLTGTKSGRRAGRVLGLRHFSRNQTQNKYRREGRDSEGRGGRWGVDTRAQVSARIRPALFPRLSHGALHLSSLVLPRCTDKKEKSKNYQGSVTFKMLSYKTFISNIPTLFIRLTYKGHYLKSKHKDA